MVGFRELYTAIREGTFEGKLTDRLNAYSPDFKIEGLVPGKFASYIRFNQADPSYVCVQLLDGAPFSPVIATSFDKEVTEQILRDIQAAGIVLLEPTLPAFITEGFRAMIEEDFYRALQEKR